MINGVLESLDLSPVLATLGQDLGPIVDTVTDGLTGSSSLNTSDELLSYNLANNILYSVNDFSGHIRTNRILAQDGNIMEQPLDNTSSVLKSQIVKSYLDMAFNRRNQSVIWNGKSTHELEYTYAPFPGLSVVSAIYANATGEVVAT